MDTKSLLRVMLVVCCIVSSVVIADKYGHTDCTYSGIRKSILSCEHTIPSNISKQTKTVFLRGFSTLTVLSNSTFQEAWENITSLVILSNNTLHVVFRTNCFTRLQYLKSLIIKVKNPAFEKRVFYGLNRLERLTLPNTHHLSEKDIFYNLNSSDLENLRFLCFLQTENYTRASLELGYQFWEFVGTVPLVSLDISNTKVTRFDMTSFNANCKQLYTLAMYDTHFKSVHMRVNETYPLVCRKINVTTSSNTFVEKIKVGCPEYKPYPNRTIWLALTDSFLFSGINVETFENMCMANFHGISIKQWKLHRGLRLTFKQTWNISHLFLIESEVKALCRGSIITHSTLTHLSLSNNGMMFVCPGAISNITTLRYLDLSSNNLNDMIVRNRSNFERIFFTLKNIENISLKNNYLRNVPKNLFLNNTSLKHIDLSFNYIEKVTIKIDHLKNLEYLNLGRNMIKTLDSSAMMQLDQQIGNFAVLNLLDNPLACSSCKSYAFITWLQERRTIWKQTVNFCTNENGTKEDVFRKTFRDDCFIKADQEDDSDTSVVVVALVLVPALMIVLAKVLRMYLDKSKN